MRGTSAYCIRGMAPGGFEETLKRAREALEGEGFGILCEIDVQAKMREKLGKAMPPYTILGACAPPLAWKALGAEPDLGVLLPCNVCVYGDAEGRTVVSAMEPTATLSLVGNAQVEEVAREVSARLHRVVQASAA